MAERITAWVGMGMILTPERKPRAIYLRGMTAWTRSQARWHTRLIEEGSHKVGAQACEGWLASMATVNQDQAFTPGMLNRVELSVKRVTSRYATRYLSCGLCSIILVKMKTIMVVHFCTCDTVQLSTLCYDFSLPTW
jgi:hypothetical protein